MVNGLGTRWLPEAVTKGIKILSRDVESCSRAERSAQSAFIVLPIRVRSVNQRTEEEVGLGARPLFRSGNCNRRYQVVVCTPAGGEVRRSISSGRRGHSPALDTTRTEISS